MDKGSYAFISYSSVNKPQADEVRRIFLTRGIPIWMAPYNIPGGTKYAAELNKALKNCGCLVLLLTEAAQASEHVEKEVERAVSYRRTIIPVQLEPVALNDAFEYCIGNCHILSVSRIREDSEDFRAVMDAVCSHVTVSQTGLPVIPERPDAPESASADFDVAEGYLRAGNPAEAAEWYRKAARLGHAEAQHKLGDCCYYGWGVAEDRTEAVRWYRMAADQGRADAQWRLGDCYCFGWGVAKDYEEALLWYRLSADQGCANAQWSLGACYSLGRGVSRDRTEAAYWYGKAADQGHLKAIEALERLKL